MEVERDEFQSDVDSVFEGDVEVETYKMTETVFTILELVKNHTLNHHNQFRVNPNYKDINMFLGILMGKHHESIVLK